MHINGLGATPLMELHLVYNLAAQYWQKCDIDICRSLVGNYTTSLDMSGCSITLTLLDTEMLKLWDAPVNIGKFTLGLLIDTMEPPPHVGILQFSNTLTIAQIIN